MKNISKAGTLLGTGGAVVGGLVAFNKGGKIGKVLLIATLFGIGGVLVGNAVTKFYEQ